MSSKRRHEAGGEAENSERWLLTYADMITLLLALFVVLFAMSSINIQKFSEFKSGVLKSFSPTSVNAILKGGTGLLQQNSLISHPGAILAPPAPSVGISAGGSTPSPVPTEAQIAQQVQQAVDAQNLQQSVQVIVARRGVVVRMLTDQAFFSTDSAALGAQGNQVVDLLGKIIYNLPNQVSVEGYTDNQPIVGGPYTSNFELSAVRAVNVVLRLTTVDGVNPVRLSATGYGETHPLVPNDTPADMAKNRRVDVVILNSTFGTVQVG